ncbi:VTT domain-containing protein [Saccharopolyspora rosea]|uniref:VTT domain-containing protein n=1 Tax=Saccharopolyspora rosea TaxID=524884 RepID=UPI0021DB5787|nr:VTT domain-containing protein [Saccharopolyspora rosea]
MSDVLAWLGLLPPSMLLLVGGLLIAAEAGLLVGVVLPGASAVLSLGAAARLGAVPWAAAAAVAAAGAVCGTQLAFHRGRRVGLPDLRLLREPRRRAEKLMRMAGPPALCAGQWLVGARTLVPRLAGSSGLAYRRFAAASVPAAAVWAVTMVELGYASADAYVRLARWMGIGAVLALLVVAVAAWLFGRISRARRATAPRRSSTVE